MPYIIGATRGMQNGAQLAEERLGHASMTCARDRDGHASYWRGWRRRCLLALANHDGMKAMDVPSQVLTVSKVEGATRQIDEAIKALERGDFDIAITLAGAAEGMFDSTGEDLWAAMHKGAQDAAIPRKDLSDDLKQCSDLAEAS
jgi:hypothetical protein